MAVTVTTILRALADLAPAPSERVLDVTRGGQPLVWLRDPAQAGRGRDAERLAAMDALRRDERILRRGWGVLAGSITVDGATRKVRLPLASEPVRLERARGGYKVVPAGDLEITPLVADRGLAAQLEQAPGIGTSAWLYAPGTRAWFETVAGATGLPAADPGPDDLAPPRLPKDGLVLYRRAVLYPARDVYSVGLGDALRAWAARPGVDDSALAHLYGTAGGSPPESDVDHPALSPLPLTAAQEAVVRRARTEPLTVVCGPPGSGKSHAVVAAALEVVDRGGSVLIATQSPHAADVLADLLGRYPGPDPVLFGDAERRERIATTLSHGAGVAVDLATLHRSWGAVNAGIAEVNALADGVRDALETERLAATGAAWEPLTVALEVDAPGAFDADADLAAAERDLDAAEHRAEGESAWRRWRRGRAWRRARRRLRLRPDVTPDRARTAIAAAKARQAVARLAATGGTDLSAAWAALAAAREKLAATVGGAMRDRARGAHRWDAEARRAAGALGTALRAGRNRRREMLASIAGGAVVRALPLWVGTVTDVEDLLPPVAGLFDLVILDEASHTDQIRAAPVLARARRALVVGDPRQLRFVSFVADLDVAATLGRHGIDGRADVRRVSAYDLAAQAAPVTWLDVHFRCAPHLIGFSAERFYEGRVDLATRHPRVESTDVIEVVPVADAVVADGVNAAEVTAAVAVVRRLAGEGRRDIGVVTPFRAQADALEAALTAAFPVAEIERLGLRVGTVHAFQGSEADVVVCSLAVGDGDSAGRLRFVSDPTLFNVMITRARHGMVVLSSLREPAGLLADYLAYGNEPPKPATAAADPGGWPGELAAQLRRLGWSVRPAYRSGRWTVDLVVGEGAEAFGVVCGVHPDGPDAHLARWTELTRSGWRLVEAYPSRWGGDPVRAALELAPLPSP